MLPHLPFIDDVFILLCTYGLVVLNRFLIVAL
jgi:hypothetical protein